MRQVVSSAISVVAPLQCCGVSPSCGARAGGCSRGAPLPRRPRRRPCRVRGGRAAAVRPPRGAATCAAARARHVGGAAALRRFILPQLAAAGGAPPLGAPLPSGCGVGLMSAPRPLGDREVAGGVWCVARSARVRRRVRRCRGVACCGAPHDARGVHCLAGVAHATTVFRAAPRARPARCASSAARPFQLGSGRPSITSASWGDPWSLSATAASWKHSCLQLWMIWCRSRSSVCGAGLVRSWAGLGRGSWWGRSPVRPGPVVYTSSDLSIQLP